MSRRLVGVLAGFVVAMAGVGAILQAPLGGPGTTAFDVRLLLVLLAFVGALLLAVTARASPGGDEATRPGSEPH